MKRYKKILLGIGIPLVLLGAFFAGHSAGAASKTPGTTGDPLVTLSYLEERLSESGGAFVQVQLSKGQTLTGQPGTRIVVLGGSVTAAGGGVVDLTEGSLTEKDTSMFLYHNYIVPENGAGCEALSACNLLVSGDYTVKQGRD